MGDIGLYEIAEAGECGIGQQIIAHVDLLQG